MTPRVGVSQFTPRAGEVAANLEVARAHLVEMAADGVSVAVLPELFASGYDLTVDQQRLAEPMGGPTLTALTAMAVELGLTIVTAVLVRDEETRLRDRGVVVTPDGVVASADKRLLWGDENGLFEPGRKGGAVSSGDDVTVGVAICYEAGFPETARDLATRGSQLIAVPAAFGRPRLHAWELMTRSRALENGCFLAAAGLTGETPSGVRFAGHSRIVGPRGEVLAAMGLEPGWVAADVSLADLAAARHEIPYLASLSQLTPTEGMSHV